MIAEVIVNSTANELDKTFDYHVLSPSKIFLLYPLQL